MKVDLSRNPLSGVLREPSAEKLCKGVPGKLAKGRHPLLANYRKACRVPAEVICWKVPGRLPTGRQRVLLALRKPPSLLPDEREKERSSPPPVSVQDHSNKA